MGLWRRVVLGLRTLFHREDADRDVADEVRHYLEEAEADLVARGHTRDEARRMARLQYGDELSAREDVRSFGWEGWVDSLASDLRLSVRSLRRTPGFTAVVVLTLGLGVGAATAIFSAVRPVLFQALPYPHPQRVLSVADIGQGGAPVPTTFGTYMELTRRNRVFASLSVFKPWQPTLTGGDEPLRLEGQSVSAAYFDVLGVHPAIGPGFDASADRPGGPHLVVLSEALWRTRFASDPQVVGRRVELDGDTYTVVGVMPATFENVTAPQARLWTLLQYDETVRNFDTREWGHHLGMIGRVRAGVSLEAARQALDAIARRPMADFPRPQWASMDAGFSARQLRDAATADARPTMLVFMGAVALLLLVTCANLTLLLLARGARRRSEFAMRVALGAGRGRLSRYLLTESLVLAAAGGLVGLALAQVGLDALLAMSPATLPRLGAIRLDGVALAFALGLTTVVGVLFGLAPGLHRTGGRPQAMREAGRGTARRSRATRRTLVVTEVALATVLLMGAGLILRSTQRLFAVPLGLDPSHVVVAQVYGTGLEHGDAATHRFFDETLEAVGAVPGVVSAAETSQLPLSGDVDTYGVSRSDGAPVGEGESDGAGYRYAVSPDYLETLGIPVTRGRGLTEADDGTSPPVALISERLARQLFPDEDPLGRRIQVGAPRPDPYTVVGVVGDVRQESLAADDGDAVYVTSHQWHWADRVRWMVVRTEGDPLALIPAIRRAIWSVNANAPVVHAQSMERVVAGSESRRHFVLVVVSAFALAALALAIIGLYGVVSGTVEERMPELGVRAALGASNERIMALVLRQGLGLTAVGVTVGLAASVVASRLLATLLFHVSRLDPLTHLAVASLLVAGTAVACLVPALRAARVNPVRALKAE